MKADERAKKVVALGGIYPTERLTVEKFITEAIQSAESEARANERKQIVEGFAVPLACGHDTYNDYAKDSDGIERGCEVCDALHQREREIVERVMEHRWEPNLGSVGECTCGWLAHYDGSGILYLDQWKAHVRALLEKP